MNTTLLADHDFMYDDVDEDVDIFICGCVDNESSTSYSLLRGYLIQSSTAARSKERQLFTKISIGQ